ncbi:MAG: LysM peptidoglycan-binding domain-containing M23 family metallopeptidase [Ferrovibrio sp.]|uniref:LysM peptidoglycan-binding domain-containing M23 family metallopeptidase n=1 Tax=Ferrovibrio sp. TaxID=1917215 RepID=UPI00262D51DF|nr:LysM peptidoglycan-binding domain-containing M23 family metallopeptidase [Ferrovibrio sp.]MCW0236431.1 LysM peptidoglycan-binding domain-containing M23 family metallopeptidase [Ferrovibrio sp.]
MLRIRVIAVIVLTGLVAACGEQAPAPVVFGHRGEIPAVTPGTPPPGGQSRGAAGAVPLPAPQGSVQMEQLAPPGGGASGRPAPNAVQQAVPQQAVSQQTAAADAVIVQPGDTVYALSRRYNRPVRAIIEDNNLQPPYALQSGQQLRLPQGRFHTVQRGETLYSISRGTGVDVYSLAQANDLQPPFGISVGQQLKVPSPTGYAVASAPAPDSPSAPQEPAPRGYQADTLPVSPGVQPPQAEDTNSAGLPPVPQAPLPESDVPARGTATPQAETEAVATASPPPSSAPVADPKQDTVLPPRSGRTFSWPVRGRVLAGFGPTPDGLHNDGINIAARAGAPVIAAENGVVVYAGSELKGFGNLLLVRHADGWMTAYAHLDKALVKKGQKVTRGQAIGTVGSTGGVGQPQLHFEIRRGTQAVDPAKFLSVA